MAIIPALIPVITEVELASAAASVELTVPSGYEILFLEYQDIYGDNIGDLSIYIRFNDDTGNNYDYSISSFGAASSTTNAAGQILVANWYSDTDGLQRHCSGLLTIFNRSGQEKVVIGSGVEIQKAGANPEDLFGKHFEAKWRNTSDEINKISCISQAGNFTAGSKFILRGLRTAKAPHLGSQDIVQFIGSADATGSSVTLPTFPKGYAMLWLFWHDIYGDQNVDTDIKLQFNGDTGGNYDYSNQPYGNASNTLNTRTFAKLGSMGDQDQDQVHSAGFATIFNRAAQEKIIILSEARIDEADVEAEDIIGQHGQNKWRNTSAEISSIVLAPSAGNFTAGKFWLIGVKIP